MLQAGRSIIVASLSGLCGLARVQSLGRVQSRLARNDSPREAADQQNDDADHGEGERLAAGSSPAGGMHVTHGFFCSEPNAEA
jgi:hypothetical protein